MSTADLERHINSDSVARAIPSERGGDRAMESASSRSLMSPPVGMEFYYHLINWLRAT